VGRARLPTAAVASPEADVCGPAPDTSMPSSAKRPRARKTWRGLGRGGRAPGGAGWRGRL